MKAVILAGGKGSRISEETHLKPKPMIEIGGKPILWHIMNIYSRHGVNDFIIALTLTSTPDAQTIPVGVSTLIGKIEIQWGPMAAAGVVGALPIVIFALVVQRNFVRGLTLGAVK